MLANELDRLNNERKKAENEIIDSINEKINSVPEILYNRVLVLSWRKLESRSYWNRCLKNGGKI